MNGQYFDISRNTKYQFLQDQIEFTGSNCSPIFSNRTNKKYFDLNSCQLPIDIRVKLKNTGNTEKTNYLFLNNAELENTSNSSQEYFEIKLKPQSDSIFSFRILKTKGLRFRPVILSSEYHLVRLSKEAKKTGLYHINKRLKISYLTKGLFISFLIFTLFFLIQLKTKEFLYYFLYQIANIIYFSDLYWLYDIDVTSWLTNDTYRGLLKTCTQPIIYYFYYRFLRYFLETKSIFQNIDKWLRIFEYSLLLIFIISFTSFYISSNFFLAFQQISRLYMSIVGICILIFFFANKNILVTYLLWGGSFLFIGSILALIFSSSPHLIPWEGIYPLDFMIAGTILEFFIFSFGLSYKIQLENKNYGILQNQLNKQLLDNQAIREKKLNYLAEQLTQAETERRIMEVELKSLRSQLNPHFLFNSLNSLKKYILKNEVSKASHYIDKFASLIRKMLSSSRKNLISLKDEIEALSLYLELENERLGFDLNWTIIVDEKLVMDEVMMPPILVQPFVENAIWHGLINKQEGSRELSIIFEDKKPLEITIKDNGIGMRAAREIQTTINKAKRKSLGTKMIKERIDLIKRFYNVEAALDINENPENGGTEIKIVLPFLKE